MSGTRTARLKAEEEANALILEQQNNPTLDNENTGDEETPPLQQQEEVRTPVNTDSEHIFEAKYKVLQGKYNAEVPQLREEIKTLKQQLDSQPAPVDESKYQKTIDELQRKLDAKESQPVTSNQELDEYIASEYGAELANAIQNMINRHAAPKSNDDVTQLRQKVEDIERNNQQSQHEMKISTLKQTLKSQGIDFEQTDTDPMFHDWLAKEEGQTGQSRSVFMQNHFASGNIAKTAAFYAAFKAQERSSYQKNPLANHVDVSSNHSAPDSGAESDMWSGDDIDRLYKDQREGRISEAEFKKQEQSLNRAMQEGRVTA